MGLLEIIDKSFVGNFLRKKSEIILSTDPDKIYVENIRSFLGTTTKVAKLLCNLAVRSGHFTKHIGIICPNNNCRKILKEVPFKDYNKDGMIYCLNCELREEHIHSFNMNQVDVIVFYRLKTL